MKVTNDPQHPASAEKSVPGKTLNDWQRKDQKQREEANEKSHGIERSGAQNKSADSGS